MKLYKRDYIKAPPTKEEIDLYKKIDVGRRGGFKRVNRKEYPEAVRHYESLFPNNHIEIIDFQASGEMIRLNEEFKCLIHDENTKERDILKFINHKPAYHIIAGIFKYYDFGHHDAYLFPEFKLVHYRADYLLIGKSSGGFEFVIVELESPNGSIVLKSGHTGVVCRKGKIQTYDWKYEIESDFENAFAKIKKYSNKDDLPEEFKKFDSTRFHYVVVAGIRDDYNEDTYRERRGGLKDSDIRLLHYDNLYDKACELESARTF